MSDQIKTEPPKELNSRAEALQHVADIALAMKEGKTIQFYCTVRNVWSDCFGVHDLSSKPHLFRIKPEPREWWVNIYENCETLFTNREDADKGAISGRIRCAKVREVIE